MTLHLFVLFVGIRELVHAVDIRDGALAMDQPIHFMVAAVLVQRG